MSGLEEQMQTLVRLVAEDEIYIIKGTSTKYPFIIIINDTGYEAPPYNLEHLQIDEARYYLSGKDDRRYHQHGKCEITDARTGRIKFRLKRPLKVDMEGSIMLLKDDKPEVVLKLPDFKVVEKMKI